MGGRTGEVESGLGKKRIFDITWLHALKRECKKGTRRLQKRRLFEKTEKEKID